MNTQGASCRRMAGAPTLTLPFFCSRGKGSVSKQNCSPLCQQAKQNEISMKMTGKCMIDAKFAKIPKIWVQFVTKNDVEIFCFVRKLCKEKKLPIFLLQLLSLPIVESVGFLKKRDRNIFCFLHLFFCAITKNPWQPYAVGAFMEIIGLYLSLPASEEDLRQSPT